MPRDVSEIAVLASPGLIVDEDALRPALIGHHLVAEPVGNGLDVRAEGLGEGVAQMPSAAEAFPAVGFEDMQSRLLRDRLGCCHVWRLTVSLDMSSPGCGHLDPGPFNVGAQEGQERVSPRR